MKRRDAEDMIEELRNRIALERGWVEELERQLQGWDEELDTEAKWDADLPVEVFEKFRDAADENLIGEDHFPEFFARRVRR